MPCISIHIYAHVVYRSQCSPYLLLVIGWNRYLVRPQWVQPTPPKLEPWIKVWFVGFGSRNSLFMCGFSSFSQVWAWEGICSRPHVTCTHCPIPILNGNLKRHIVATQTMLAICYWAVTFSWELFLSMSCSSHKRTYACTGVTNDHPQQKIIIVFFSFE